MGRVRCAPRVTLRALLTLTPTPVPLTVGCAPRVTLLRALLPSTPLTVPSRISQAARSQDVQLLPSSGPVAGMVTRAAPRLGVGWRGARGTVGAIVRGDRTHRDRGRLLGAQRVYGAVVRGNWTGRHAGGLGGRWGVRPRGHAPWRAPPLLHLWRQKRNLSELSRLWMADTHTDGRTDRHEPVGELDNFEITNASL